MFADDGWTVRSDERTLKALYEKAIKNVLELINLSHSHEDSRFIFVTYTVIYRIQPAIIY